MAQEKPTERDKSIGSNLATENIDVRSSGHFYPVEYSSMIQYYDRTNQLKAKIPEALAGVVTAYNDFQNIKYSLEEETKVKAEENKFNYDTKLEEHKLMQDQNNLVYDRYKQMQSDYDDLMQQARLQGSTNRFETIEQNLKDKYENWEDASPYMQETWRQMYNSHIIPMLSKAKELDYDYAEWTSQNTVQNYQNDLLKGISIDISTRQQSYRALANYLGSRDDLPFQNKQGSFQEHYNNSLKVATDYIRQSVETDKLPIEEGIIALNNLLKEKSINIPLTNSKGKPILDADKNPQVLIGTMDPKTQSYIFNTFSTLNNYKAGVNGESEILATNITSDVDDYIKIIGYEKLPNGKVNYNRNRFRTLQEFDTFTIKVIDNILNAKIKESTKIAQLKRVLTTGGAVYADFAINETMALSKGRAGDSLAEGINRARRLINAGDLETLVKEGITYIDENGNTKSIKLPSFMNTLVRLGNSEVSAELYLEDYIERLETYKDKITSGDVSYILDSSDIAYSDANTNIKLILSKQNYDKTQEQALKESIIQRDTRARNKGFGYAAFSFDDLSSCIQNINSSSKTDFDKLNKSMSFGKLLAETGHADDILAFDTMTGTQIPKGSSDIVKYMYAGVLMSGSKGSEILQDYYKDKYTAQARQDFIQSEPALKDKTLNARCSNLIKKHVPKKHQSLVLNVLKDLVAAGVSQGIDIDDMFDTGEQVLRDNFIKMPSSCNLEEPIFMKGKTIRKIGNLINNGGYTGLNKAENTKTREATISLLTSYNKNLNNVFKSLGKNNSNYIIKEDSNLGTFKLYRKTQKGTVSLDDMTYFGRKYSIGNMNIENLNSTNATDIGALNAITLGYGILATDSNALKYAYDTGYISSKPITSNMVSMATDLSSLTKKTISTFGQVMPTIGNLKSTVKSIKDKGIISTAENLASSTKEAVSSTAKNIKSTIKTSISTAKETPSVRKKLSYYYKSPEEAKKSAIAGFMVLNNPTTLNKMLLRRATGGAIQDMGNRRSLTGYILGL